MSAQDSTSGFAEVARRGARSFERASRLDGERFTRLVEGAPEWVREAVKAGHGTDQVERMLPDDYAYATVAEAFERVAEACESDSDSVDLDEVGWEFADDVQVYSSDLLAWYGSHSQRKALVEEAQQEGLTSTRDGDSQDIERQIMAGQFLERQRIYAAVVEAIREQAELCGKVGPTGRRCERAAGHAGACGDHAYAQQQGDKAGGQR
jgi:hypothetical protein